MIRRIKYFLLKVKNAFRRYSASNISSRTFFGKNVQIFGINNILIGDYCTIGDSTLFTINDRTNNNLQLTIGNSTYIGRDSFFSVGKSIVIGDFCIFGNKCSFICSDHIFNTPLIPYALSGNSYIKEIKIGVNCWFGHNVSVIGNVTVGHGCVIGANAMVTKSLPPFTMAVGNPARVLKTFNFSSNNWEEGTKKVESVYEDESVYLEYLKNNFDRLPFGYHAASSNYGDL